MKRGVALVAWISVLAVASAARADDLAALRLEAWDALDGTARPYRYVVSLRAERSIDAVVDRRLLAFEVRPIASRRRYRCRHPRAPRRASAARTRALAPGEVWREWVDLRMYCTGAALRALEAGAEVRPSYGWRRPSSRLWVARVEGTPTREWTGGFTPEPFAFPALEASRVTVRAGAEAEPAPIDLVLSPATASRQGSLVFSVSVRAREGTERVYLRPDSFSFAVRGPDGESACRMAPWGGRPVADLYRRITRRYGWTERLEARAFCEDHAFDRAGLYEIVPKVRLPHDGAEWGFEAVTGRFLGPAATVRILDDASGEYVEQAIVEPEDAGE